ncbi:MAG: prepilin peptidase, partial [Candidatus Omnitrophota bacterium]
MGIFIFILGLAFGSFANVCIYRLPKSQSIIWPGSYCP